MDNCRLVPNPDQAEGSIPGRGVACAPILLNAFDGIVGFLDFLILANNFTSSGAMYSQGDINCDGEVTFNDFLLLATNFG